MLASRRSQTTAFFVLAFSLAWVLWIPAALGSGSQPSPLALTLVLIGAFAPTVAAVLLTGLRSGRVGIRERLGRLLVWRVGAKWYVSVLLGTVGIGFLTVVLHALLGGPAPSFSPTVPWFILPLAFLVNLLFGGALNEEVGWRGYALPRLQSEWSALRSSLMLGLLWALWHMPVFFIVGTSQSEMPFIAFALWVVALSILLTWVYNGTGGSLLLVTLAHGAVNFTAGSLFPIFPPRVDGTTPFLLYSALFGVAAIAVVLLTGSENLSRKPRVAETTTT